MDITQVKNLIGIKTDKHDNYLHEIVPLFVDLAKEKCNNSFLVDGEEVLPAGVKLYIAKANEHNMGDSTLKGKTMGSVTYSYETELPQSITKYLSPYKKVRFI